MSIEQRRLGTSEITVPVVGIGCNAFGSRIDADATRAVVDAALDHGVTFFDTADSYGLGESETLLGRALGRRRQEVVIATKFGFDMQGRNGDDGGRRGAAGYVRTAAEASLRRLGTDYLDLYQYHTPDRQTPIAETLGALHELVTDGLVRAIGCSNLQAWELVDADWTARSARLTRFATVQNEYSLYNRMAEVELVPACRELGVGILPYFPLAYGLLTGKYRRGEPAPAGSRLERQGDRLASADWDTVESLTAFAEAHGVGLLEVAMGGLAAQPAVTSVIAGISSAGQVAANVAAVGWRPDAEAAGELAAMGRPGQTMTGFAAPRS